MGNYSGIIEVVFVFGVVRPKHSILMTVYNRLPRVEKFDSTIHEAAANVCRELVGEPLVDGQGYVPLFQQTLVETEDRISVPYFVILPEQVPVGSHVWKSLDELKELSDLDQAILSGVNWSVACGIG